MKHKGFMAIILVATLLILTTAAVILGKSYQMRVNNERERWVAGNAIIVLHALDDYFLAECSEAHSRAVTAPGSVNELVEEGYLPARNYDNPFGSSFSFGFDTSSNATILYVEFTVRDANQAKRLTRYGSVQAKAEATGSAVRFSRRTSQYDSSSYRQDEVAFHGDLLCI